MTVKIAVGRGNQRAYEDCPQPGSVWDRPSLDYALEANDCASLVRLFADTKRRSIEAALPHYNCRTEAGPGSQRSWIRAARR